MIGIVGATSLPKNIYGKIRQNQVVDRILGVAEPVVLAFLLLLSTAYLVDGSFNPFLYFRF